MSDRRSASPVGPGASTVPKPHSPLRQEANTEMLANAPLAMESTSDLTSLNSEKEQKIVGNVNEASRDWRFWPALLRTLLEIVIASACIMAPAICLHLLKDYEKYNLLTRKFPDAGLNHYQEFTRWSIFFAMAYSTFVAAQWLAMAVPVVLRKFSKISKGGQKVSRHFVYLQEISRFTGWALFFALVFVEAALLLYHPLALKPSVKAGQAMGAFATVQFYFERAVIVLTVVSAFVALEKWLIRMISVSFHKTAFMDRVRELNFRFAVIKHLHKWATEGNTGRLSTFGLPPPRAHRRESKDLDALTEFEHARTEDLDVARAEGRKIASDILKAFPNIEKLTPQQLMVVFPESADESVADYKDAFEVFTEEVEQVSVSREEFTGSIIDVLEQRQNVHRSMVANARIVGKLDIVLLSITLFIATVICAPFYDLKIDEFLASFGLLAGTAALLFKNVAQSIFNAFMFVFIEHAFDVGDRVVIGAENLIVQNIEIFTTTLVKWDGVKVYWPNSILATKDIENIRRSACQSETIDISIGSSTSTDRLWELKKQLTEYVKSQPEDFTGYLDIAGYDIISKETMKLQLIVQYKTNFQDQAKRHARRSKFMLAVREIVTKAGITYFS